MAARASVLTWNTYAVDTIMSFQFDGVLPLHKLSCFSLWIDLTKRITRTGNTATNSRKMFNTWQLFFFFYQIIIEIS